MSVLRCQKDVRRTLLCTEEMGAGGPFGSTLVSSPPPPSLLCSPPPRVRVVVWYSMRVPMIWLRHLYVERFVIGLIACDQTNDEALIAGQLTVQAAPHT